jgi:hypothetical protein
MPGITVVLARAIVPDPVIVPPVNPVLAVIEVTVPLRVFVIVIAPVLAVRLIPAPAVRAVTPLFVTVTLPVLALTPIPVPAKTPVTVPPPPPVEVMYAVSLSINKPEPTIKGL